MSDDNEVTPRKMQRWNATPKLNKAIAAARLEIENPHFDSENPHFRSKFASLKAVIDATVKVYAKHGIALIQDLQTVEGGVACYTHFLHESGEERTLGPFVVPMTKSDAQGYASASTYARRYHLMGVATVVGDKDDDGNAASESAFKSKQAKTKARNGLRAAASESRDEDTRNLWNELDNDQRAELWDSFAKADKDLITESLAKTKETT